MLCGIPFPIMITVCLGVDGECFHHTIWFGFLIADFQDILERSWGVLTDIDSGLYALGIGVFLRI